MRRKHWHRDFAVALFVLGLLLFNFPLLSAANRPLILWGIPALFIYLFAAWLILIVAIAWSARRLPADHERSVGNDEMEQR